MSYLLLVLALIVLLLTAAHAGPSALALRVPVGRDQTVEPVTLTLPDIKGSYTIPHIQSEPELRFDLEFPAAGSDRARVTLLLEEREIARKTVTRARPRTRVLDLAPGEYRVNVEGLDAAGGVVSRATYERIGVGAVICAIGDSITEGYHGHWFWRDDLNLHGDMFPPEAVSRDGRNFPQYSPTTSYHRPEVNCFQSWMTDLNNTLAAAWQQPVYIANEGYGGITSGAYLNTIRGDKGWQHRMELLRPTVWIIHLGVNDERHKVTPEQFAANMEAIVDELVRVYQAAPGRILVARPCYDYAAGMAEVERRYIAKLDELIARRSLRQGPDFFAAYGVDQAKWYGTDPVHPNIAGMTYMAKLWGEAILQALPQP